MSCRRAPESAFAVDARGHVLSNQVKPTQAGDPLAGGPYYSLT